jgi:hypothetical protein
MIEVIETKIIDDPNTNQPAFRHANIVITSGGTGYKWGVGGLPLKGDLQTILDAREDELWQAATQKTRPADVYQLADESGVLLKAVVQVLRDEINILRGRLVLPERSAEEVETKIKDKLKAN